MYKRFSFIFVLVIIALGIVFIGLDILDVAEDFRLSLPYAVFNTVFIALAAAAVAYLAAGSYSREGKPETLFLGIAALAFGTGILVYSWFTGVSLDARLTVYDASFLILAFSHFLGMLFGKLKLNAERPARRHIYTPVAYSGIFLVIVAVAWFLHSGVLPSLLIPRAWAHGIGAIVCLAAAAVYCLDFIKSRSDFYYWYFLGLVLFASGVLFMAQGPLESRIAWLGRAAQYCGYVYFLKAAFSAYRQARAMHAVRSPVTGK
jgi:hypothetical protein